MGDVFEVKLTRRAQSDLRKVPRHIAVKLLGWIDAVSRLGLRQIRQVKGFHDEPLLGRRAGQRSIRLSAAYRAIYRLDDQGGVEFVSIDEVNKHDY